MNGTYYNVTCYKVGSNHLAHWVTDFSFPLAQYTFLKKKILGYNLCPCPHTHVWMRPMFIYLNLIWKVSPGSLHFNVHLLSFNQKNKNYVSPYVGRGIPILTIKIMIYSDDGENNLLVWSLWTHLEMEEGTYQFSILNYIKAKINIYPKKFV